MIRVLIADDHAIVREGIRSLLMQSPGRFSVVAAVADGRQLMEAAESTPADVILVDIAMPQMNGLEAARRILKKDPSKKIVMLSMHDDRASVEKALEAGVSGYLVKDSAIDEVARAIDDVMKGKIYLSSKIACHVETFHAGRKSEYAATERLVDLTDKELEVLQLLAEGLRSKEIASRLKVSFNTVNVHRQNIMRKLGLHKLADLVRYAIREGISRV